MAAYHELVKNFEKVRAYMREFYVYGFKSRTEYDARSARSYDNERRRLESWLGDHMRFTQTPEGTRKNPFYRAWKSKSFTDGDITLHFAIFDILYAPEIRKTLSELVRETDELLSSRMTFDESTLRKKLKEYAGQGIIRTEREGRRVLYSRAPDTDLSRLNDVIDFFSEAAPCGVVGSFLQDRQPEHPELFSFKHHYITQAMDSDVMAMLFEAMGRRCYITADNLGKHAGEVRTLRLVPLKIYISAQNGRQNLIAYHEKSNRLNTYRLDYMSSIRMGEVCEKFDALRRALQKAEAHMWGVNCVRRLEREKRCGTVEQVDEHHYRFTAEVFDTVEMLPWIRTFICRITKMNFSNRTAENRFKADIQEMYRMYGIDGGEEHDIQ